MSSLTSVWMPQARRAWAMVWTRSEIRAGGLADGGSNHGVLILDDAGFGDVGGEPGGAADDVLCAENG